MLPSLELCKTDYVRADSSEMSVNRRPKCTTLQDVAIQMTVTFKELTFLTGGMAWRSKLTPHLHLMFVSPCIIDTII